MKKKNKILAIIPARSGSKSIVDKNIRDIAGKPMIAWSIQHALDSTSIDRVIVSTDNQNYAKLALKFGAEVPFLRPQNISGDHATDLEVFKHALNWLKLNENYEPDICVHLRPTCPIRTISDIDAIVNILILQKNIDSVRTITPSLHSPYKMWTCSENGLLTSVTNNDCIKEPWNEPRQKLPQTYIQSANIDAVRTSVIKSQNSMTGQIIHGFKEKKLYDIDEEEDLQLVDSILRQVNIPIEGPTNEMNRKTYCFDIDGVIASITEGNNYYNAKPCQEMIDQINLLHSCGHKIILFTARGTATGIDWKKLTTDQMNSWGVKHDELRFGKPAADFYIDDKMIGMKSLLSRQSESL